MLLPLDISDREGQAVHVGLVMSMIGLGMLAAPLWGRLVDRWRAHRWLTVIGAVAVALSLVGFAFTPDLGGIEELRYLIGLAILLGLGQSVIFTIANILIVQTHPEAEWNRRIGWLQTFVTGGTVFGLATGGVLTDLPIAMGLFFGAAVAATAAVLFLLNVPTPQRRPATSRAPSRAESLPALVAGVRARLFSPFGLFLAAWLCSLVGVQAITNLYPLYMRHDFDVDPTFAGFTLSIATALSLPLYSPAGSAITRFRVLSVLRWAMLARVACLGVLVLIGAGVGDGRAAVAMLAVAGLTLAWPFLSVGGTLRASQLSGESSGVGLGLFNAVAALAAMIGPALGGQLATITNDYTPVSVLGVAGLGLALILLTFGPRSPRRDPVAPRPSPA